MFKVKAKICKRKKCWEYCTECNGAGLIVIDEPGDELLTPEQAVEKYHALAAKYGR